MQNGIDAKLWPETKVSNQTYRLNQSLRPKFGIKTKLNLSNPVSNQTVVMHLDRQLSLIS